MRNRTKEIKVGNVKIGGGNPISIQTMTNTKTWDVESTVAQIKECRNAGADIIRVTVNDDRSADAISEVVRECSPLIPIVADIHFNYLFAMKSIDAGVAKVRINPGNIGSRDKIGEVLLAAKEHNIPIRIGVNSGSLEKDILEKYGMPTAEALYESAMKHIEIANSFDFDDIVVSVKSSSVPLMIEANRLLAEKCDYPLHLGVTEAGTLEVGTLKSAVGIGTLLSEGIGDTIRISLTESPVKEVETAKLLLSVLNLRRHGIEIISCPTCGRTEVDLIKIVHDVEKAVKGINKSIKIAIMGCIVNGPGEAREADFGIACGKGSAVVIRQGEVIKKIREDEIIENVLKEIDIYQ